MNLRNYTSEVPAERSIGNIELGRQAIGIDLSPEYAELISQRTNITPGLRLA